MAESTEDVAARENKIVSYFFVCSQCCVYLQPELTRNLFIPAC